MSGSYGQAALEAHFAAINKRMDHIEQQLVKIADRLGVGYQTYADSLQVPPEVVELVRAGKQLEALKRYRELTGADVEDAREAIATL